MLFTIGKNCRLFKMGRTAAWEELSLFGIWDEFSLVTNGRLGRTAAQPLFFLEKSDYIHGFSSIFSLVSFMVVVVLCITGQVVDVTAVREQMRVLIVYHGGHERGNGHGSPHVAPHGSCNSNSQHLTTPQ